MDMRAGLVALMAGATAVAFLVGGCGQQAGTSALDSTLVTTTPQATAAAPPATASPDSQCTSIGMIITNSDNGKTLCVYQGTDVLVLLATDSGGIRVTGPLTPRPELVPALVPGVTGAAFVASQPGVARILSVLAPCGSGPGVHCMLLMLYHVTLDIVAPASLSGTEHQVTNIRYRTSQERRAGTSRRVPSCAGRAPWHLAGRRLARVPTWHGCRRRSWRTGSAPRFRAG
jgi:hypothetical protein